MADDTLPRPWRADLPMHDAMRTVLTPPPGVPARQPQHPGRFLERQYLVPLGLNQTRAAALLGVSRRRVNELVMGHRAFTPDTAVRCALVFGMSASFWMSLQTNFDLHQAWRDLREQATRSDPAV